MMNSYQNRVPWEMDVEYPNWKRDIHYEGYFAVDKNPVMGFNNGFYKSSYVHYVLTTKKKVASYKYIDIYK